MPLFFLRKLLGISFMPYFFELSSCTSSAVTVKQCSDGHAQGWACAKQSTIEYNNFFSKDKVGCSK